jgi:hypothetical protein
MAKKHVFISYCRENETEVAGLRGDLMAAGEVVWWDRDIMPGEDWRQAIQEAMKNSYAVVLCLSKESEARTTSGIYSEAAEAITFYRTYPPNIIFLIPLRLSECKIPPIRIDDTRNLDTLQYVDLFPEDRRADGLNQLTKAIQKSSEHP